jgi:hypothetical protein
MKVVSWNCRGLGQREKKKAKGNFIKTERPHILLIQETKMQGFESLREMKQIWKESNGISLNARGMSREIYIVWNTKIFREEQKLESSHWILVHLKNLQTVIDADPQPSIGPQVKVLYRII